MSGWFILLALVTAWASLVLASTISQDPQLRNSDLTIRPETFILFIFLILTGKSIIDTLHKAIESKELITIMTQPVSAQKVATGKFLGILLSNLAIVAFGLGLMASIQLGSFWLRPDNPLSITGEMPDGSGSLWVGGYGITHLQILAVIIMAFLASCMGFTYSILNSLDLKRRIGGLLLYSQLVTAIFVVMRWNENLASGSVQRITPVQETLALLGIMLLAFAGLYPTIRYLYFEVWTKETSGKKAMWFQKRSWGGLRWLERPFSPIMARLIKKELIINVQKKEILGNIIAIIGLSALLIWGWQRIADLKDIPARAQQVAYPAIISVGIYLATILQCGFIGLGSIGKEGRKFWVLKSLPVPPKSVFMAKAWAILALSPITVIGVALPLPFILNYSPVWKLFFVLMTLAMIMTFTGLGLIMGARYPNFNESTGGMPDVMTMYLLMILCLGFGGGMFVFAGYTLARDMLMGMLATTVCLELGFIIMLVGINGGAFLYSRIEPRTA
jgi:hypothetical protein